MSATTLLLLMLAFPAMWAAPATETLCVTRGGECDPTIPHDALFTWGRGQCCHSYEWCMGWILEDGTQTSSFVEAVDTVILKENSVLVWARSVTPRRPQVKRVTVALGGAGLYTCLTEV
ncbi:hypothetical protein C0Q70_11349 [Pomacea canaliculata]|uniref:Ig-like domain-containing protein n=1 Tax=Pomacea canaliculata TaxID=400727 RepID=A0A2T7P5Q4_POMCA|nr:hypothetical protein C0Q70_11349 [Pomacea canaliculata]